MIDGRGLRIGLDGMGGDFAPDEVVKGGLDALREGDFELYIFGKGLCDLKGVNVVETPEVIGMDEQPVKAFKMKRNSSIVRGLEYLRDGRIDAFVSAGNTGAILVASLFVLGKFEWLERPALTVTVSTKNGPVVFLDAGANMDCRARFLLDFAKLGAFYIERIYGKENPRVALLSTGEEEGKGNKLVREAYELLKRSGLNFIGNIESRDIMKGMADVVVTDGFTGNVVIKLTEGLGEAFINLALGMDRGLYRKLVSPFTKPVFIKAYESLMDYSGYGVAPLLGVKGNVIVAHGRSRAPAIKRAILVALDIARKGIVEKLIGG